MARVICTALAAAPLLLAGCGGGTSTRTVTVYSAAPPAATTPSPATTTAETTTTPTTTSTLETTTQQTVTTRTASEPEFVEHHVEGLAGASAKVRSLGYTPVDESQYHPHQTLRVLVGARDGVAGGYQQLAFFFIGNRYIGTDVKVPSAKISIASQGESEVTVVYPLYRAGESACCPASTTNVTFALENGHLMAQQTIPSAARRNPPARS